MEKYNLKIKSIFKLDNKALVYYLVYFLSVFVYGIIRTYFITNTDNLYATVKGSTYIELIQEILMMLVVSPTIFFYKNAKEKNNSYITILIYASIISLLFMLISLTTMPLIVNQLKKVNNWASTGSLYRFLISAMIGNVFIIYLYV